MQRGAQREYCTVRYTWTLSFYTDDTLRMSESSVFRRRSIYAVLQRWTEAVDLEICPYTMVGTRFYLVLEKSPPSANHCVLGQVNSTQLVQNVFLSKIGVWGSI